MCFSAQADFAAAAGVGAIGVATLLRVRRPRLALFAALPLLFAAHQAVEGVVWLSMDGRLSVAAAQPFVFAFMLYAQALLPFLMAAAVLLIEPPGRRRSAIAATAAVGAALCAWAAWALVVRPDVATVEGRCLVFRNHLTDSPWMVAVYALPACGAPLLSSRPSVRTFGALNLIGMAGVLAVRAYALTSVWCLYAACLSVMIYRVVGRTEAWAAGRSARVAAEGTA